MSVAADREALACLIGVRHVRLRAADRRIRDVQEGVRGGVEDLVLEHVVGVPGALRRDAAHDQDAPVVEERRRVEPARSHEARPRVEAALGEAVAPDVHSAHRLGRRAARIGDRALVGVDVDAARRVRARRVRVVGPRDLDVGVRSERDHDVGRVRAGGHGRSLAEAVARDEEVDLAGRVGARDRHGLAERDRELIALVHGVVAVRVLEHGRDDRRRAGARRCRGRRARRRPGRRSRRRPGRRARRRRGRGRTDAEDPAVERPPRGHVVDVDVVRRGARRDGDHHLRVAGDRGRK